VNAKAFQETGKIPSTVIRRISDFRPPAKSDERLDYFRSSLQLTRKEISLEYERAMRSLYKKEFAVARSDLAGW